MENLNLDENLKHIRSTEIMLTLSGQKSGDDIPEEDPVDPDGEKPGDDIPEEDPVDPEGEKPATVIP